MVVAAEIRNNDVIVVTLNFYSLEFSEEKSGSGIGHAFGFNASIYSLICCLKCNLKFKTLKIETFSTDVIRDGNQFTKLKKHSKLKGESYINRKAKSFD